MAKKTVSLKKAAPKSTKARSIPASKKQMGSLEKFRRMATVIQDSNDAITFQDLEGNILAWNRGAEIIYGYSEAEALRMNIVDTVPKEYREEALAFLSSLKRGELVPNLETKRRHKDGRIIDVWLTNTKLTDDKGNLTGIATTERDISEQTKTLEKFRRMATVIQDSNDAITFQDLEGNILAWNRGAEIIYGYPEDEALSMNIVDTVPKEYQAQALAFLSSLKRGELVPNLETKRKTKDGRIVDVWLTNTKLTDEKGKLTGIATTERDISEQTKTLEKFRRMATVIQDSNDAITFQDLEGNILAWNRGAEIIYGYSEAEALNMNIVDTVPYEYQEEALAFLSSLKRGELVPNLETKRRHKDGRIIDVWLTNTKLTDDKGNLTGIATTERDISEQTKTLEKFRRMATVIQDSNDAITFQDLEGNILAWNRGAEIIYGYSEAEALSMNIVDTVPKEYQEQALAFLSSLKRGELVPNLETKRKTKDGRIVDVWLTNTKLTDEKGMLTGIATTERDITERKQTEATLRDKFRELEYLREGQIALSERMRGEQILSSLGQSILSHLVMFTNAQVGAFYWVAEKRKLHKVSSYALPRTEGVENYIAFGEGLIGQVAIEKQSLLIEHVPPTYFTKIQSHLGGMVPKSLLICPILYEGEVNAVIELGSMHTFTEHQRAFLGHVSENIGIAINTSVVRKKVQQLLEQSQTDNEELQARQEELRVSNEELEEQTQALERQKNILNERNDALKKAQVLLEEKATEVQRASQYKTEFLANMSHELRTPLNSSLILSRLLMDNAKGNLTAEQVQFAESIYSSGNDLLCLINDILDLSKVEAGKLDVRVEKVSILQVIDELKLTFGPVAKEKKLNFEVKYEPGMQISLLTDRQRLDQILKNLLSNAFKFTAEGSVKIRLFRPANGQVAFEVSDSGIGILKAQQEIIFEAFRQADGTTNRKYGGTGLGLSISRDLAKLLGGTIDVDSSENMGSRFTLILPEVFVESEHQIPVKAYSSQTNPPNVPAREPYKQPYLKSVAPLNFADDRAELGDARRLILVIEDEVKFSKILFDLAHELNYKCIVAQGADEGFEMANAYNPDAILLDMKLPDHPGLTVLDRLKENPKTRHIPVHIIAGEDYMEAALHMGAIGYMLKPVKRDEIKNAFSKLESKFTQTSKRILVVEDDEIQREGICQLIADAEIEIITVSSAEDALLELNKTVFDCMIMDLNLPGMNGIELLEKMSHQEIYSFPPVIVYTGSSLSREEEEKLRKYSKAIIIKGARSPERLLDEVTLFLHRVEAKMPEKSKQMLKVARSRDQLFEGRKILLVDDDIRNIFALTSALEQRGATVLIGRNGHEALDQLDQDPKIDLVLMDIMMPEMDGYEATRRIRQQGRFAKLPIIAVTAKAMIDDQEKCLEAGTNDFLSKPVDLDKLLSLMRVWMPKFGTYNATPRQ
ncbi:MAG TPA: PAS domain S-box protein [Bacteriovoracaceae bacterium]|nr:PAS domain S-box protein [Bacteriovoracaceae bacterium]